jgi:hypothetical protein
MTAVSPTTTAPPAGGSILPTSPIPVDPQVAQLLQAAVTSGEDDAKKFASYHDSSERWLVGSYVINHLGWPPGGDKQKAELETMHRIAATRTPDGIQAAVWLGAHGMSDPWEAYLAEYQKGVGPAQAAHAAKLLHDTMDMVNQATQIQKAAAGRKRPYDEDPTLTVAIEKPGGSPSFPSGHTSAAYAAAIVLSYLMPEKKTELLGLAQQVAFSRVYGGVHYPSDVAAGARLGAAIALYTTGIDAHPLSSAPAGLNGKRRRKAAAHAA